MSSKTRNTEYGPISEKLLRADLSDLCVNKHGVQTGPFGSQLHKKDYVEDGTPIITVEHLGDNRITHENTPFVSDDDKKRLSKYHLQEGDIVFSRVGSVDRRALVRKTEEGWLFSGRCLRVRVNKEKINPIYLSYFFGLESFKNYIRSIAVGATMPSLNTKMLSGVQIYYPESLVVQKRIAHYLHTLDEKIQLNHQINQTLEQMAQAIFKSWFVDFEPVKAKMAALEAGGNEDDALLATMQAIAGSALFASDAADADAATQLARLQAEHPEQYTTLRATAELFPAAMQDSELGEIPEGWSTKSIYEIADVIYGAPFKSKLFNTDGNGLPLVRIRDLKNERPGVSTPELHPKGYLIQNGDLLVGMDGEFRPYIWGGNEAWMNQRVCTFKPKDKLSAALIKEFITRQLRFFELTTVATTVIHLGKGDIDSFTYLNPNSELLHICSKILEPLFQKVVSNKVEIISLEEIRDALLPKLLSGELSVNQDVD